MSNPMSQDEVAERLEANYKTRVSEMQDAWRNWDPQTPMPDIISPQTRGHSGWDLEFEAQIARNMGHPSPLPEQPSIAPSTTGSTASERISPSTNGRRTDLNGDDSDDSYGAIPPDDEFMDPLDDRSYLEFVLQQRGCAARRAALNLPQTSCSRSQPCADCRQHEGFSVPITYWQFIGDEALEEHVGNYLRIRPSLPVWQPSTASNLQSPQLVFGHTSSSAGGGIAAAPAGPPAPLPFNDELEDMRTD